MSSLWKRNRVETVSKITFETCPTCSGIGYTTIKNIKVACRECAGTGKIAVQFDILKVYDNER